MNSLVIRPHLGLGDMLIINALVRETAGKFGCVILPCKKHNVTSVSFMFRDIGPVIVSPVADDAAADRLVSDMQSEGAAVLKLGMFGAGKFNPSAWDRQMYEQAGMPFEWRWERFYVHPGFTNNILPHLHGTVFGFVHDDPVRGFVIPRNEIPKLEIIRPLSGMTDNIFDYCQLIGEAKEIHCIDSCFAILTESIPTSEDRLVFHLRVRPGARPPTLRKNWQIIR